MQYLTDSRSVLLITAETSELIAPSGRQRHILVYDVPSDAIVVDLKREKIKDYKRKLEKNPELPEPKVTEIQVLVRANAPLEKLEDVLLIAEANGVLIKYRVEKFRMLRAVSDIFDLYNNLRAENSSD